MFSNEIERLAASLLQASTGGQGAPHKAIGAAGGAQAKQATDSLEDLVNLFQAAGSNRPPTGPKSNATNGPDAEQQVQDVFNTLLQAAQYLQNEGQPGHNPRESHGKRPPTTAYGDNNRSKRQAPQHSTPSRADSRGHDLTAGNQQQQATRHQNPPSNPQQMQQQRTVRHERAPGPGKARSSAPAQQQEAADRPLPNGLNPAESSALYERLVQQARPDDLLGFLEQQLLAEKSQMLPDGPVPPHQWPGGNSSRQELPQQRQGGPYPQRLPPQDPTSGGMQQYSDGGPGFAPRTSPAAAGAPMGLAQANHHHQQQQQQQAMMHQQLQQQQQHENEQPKPLRFAGRGKTSSQPGPVGDMGSPNRDFARTGHSPTHSTSQPRSRISEGSQMQQLSRQQLQQQLDGLLPAGFHPPPAIRTNSHPSGATPPGAAIAGGTAAAARSGGHMPGADLLRPTASIRSSDQLPPVGPMRPGVDRLLPAASHRGLLGAPPGFHVPMYSQGGSWGRMPAQQQQYYYQQQQQQYYHQQQQVRANRYHAAAAAGVVGAVAPLKKQPFVEVEVPEVSLVALVRCICPYHMRWG